MMDDVTSEEVFSSVEQGGFVSSTSPPPGMDSAVVIASVTVVCVIIAVVITVLVLCWYKRRRRRNQADLRKKTDAKRPKSGHGSSTMRSDKSDHPYENPSLPRKLRADHAAKVAKESSKPGAGQHSDPYSNLKGQSLPHHYQGLNQGPPSLEDSVAYDELMPPSTCSEENSSDYYFKLEAGSRSNTGVRTGVQPGGRPAVDPTDPDEAYDLVVVGNHGNATSNNSNQNADRSNKSRTSKDDDANPYYFKVDNLQGGGTARASFRNHGNDNQTNKDKALSSDQGKGPRDEIDSKPLSPTKPKDIVAKDFTVRERVNSYDKLNRHLSLPVKKTGDINGNEYDKLVPQLSVKPHNGNSITTSNDGYLQVNIGDGVDDTDNDNLTEVNDYNKLDRGVEKEFDNIIIVSDNDSSTV